MHISFLVLSTLWSSEEHKSIVTQVSYLDFDFENVREKQHDDSCQLQQLEVMTVNKEELVREYLQGDSTSYTAYEGRQ